ncbi:portal protein [Aeromonas veronii]|uniref:portal protein n=1 Tax=Aeromonas veronii TaxID=654 RepID=UPI0024419560|nr:hypothetical protein [Aeromonas veronii]
MNNPTEITLPGEAVEQLSPLDVFGASRFRDLDNQLQQRSLVEQRWLDDLRQYRGEYEPEFVKELENAKKSQAFVNITREKTDAWAAQMGDMLFPVDDKNYGIAPSPDPKLSLLAKQMMTGANGEQQPTDSAQAASQILAAAQAAATAMEKTIDDQLIACDYNAESRRMLHYAAKIGTGIIKGPIVESAIKQAWLPGEDGSWAVEIAKDLKPGARCVLPWDFVPDMSATRFADCEFVYEREYMTKKELRKLLNLTDMGFIPEQIEKLLAQDPSTTRTRYAEFVDQIRYLCGLNPTSQDSRYEVWTYHGPVPIELLAVAGVDIRGLDGREFDGVIIFSGDVILKVTINPMDTLEWPYSVYVCEPDEGSIFGLSMPYLMRHPQRIINSAWRAMLDNAAKTVGPQVVVNKRLITPSDGNWEATPFKVWEMDSNVQWAEVQKAFGVFHFDSRQSDMANILQLALSLLDREAGVPMISQGGAGAGDADAGRHVDADERGQRRAPPAGEGVRRQYYQADDPPLLQLEHAVQRRCRH